MSSNLFSAGDLSLEDDSENLIRVGSLHFSTCPMCGECFSLKWPNRVHHVPADAIVNVECPRCRHEYAEIAEEIDVATADVRLSVGLVRRIEARSGRQ